MKQSQGNQRPRQANEEAMLARIAQRLGHNTADATTRRTRLPWAPAESLPSAPPVLALPELVRRFLTELTRLGGHGVRVESTQEAIDYVARVTGAGPALLWDDPRLAALRLPAALAAGGCEVALWNDALDPAAAKRLAATSRVGITSADWAVAETGTITLPTGPNRGRLVSLLPPVHIALLPEDRVLPSMAELFRSLAGEARAALAAGLPPLPSSLALATGPSRSADIENDLTIGVHGPAEVHVVLLPPREGQG